MAAKDDPWFLGLKRGDKVTAYDGVEGTFVRFRYEVGTDNIIGAEYVRDKAGPTWNHTNDISKPTPAANLARDLQTKTTELAMALSDVKAKDARIKDLEQRNTNQSNLIQAIARALSAASTSHDTIAALQSLQKRADDSPMHRRTQAAESRAVAAERGMEREKARGDKWAKIVNEAWEALPQYEKGLQDYANTRDLVAGVKSAAARVATLSKQANAFNFPTMPLYFRGPIG